MTSGVRIARCGKNTPTLSLPRKGGGQNTGVSESVSLPLAGRGQGWGYVSRTG